MNENKLPIALCQIRTELDLDETLKKTEKMVSEAAQNGAKIVCLPEMFSCPYARAYFKDFARMGHEKVYAAMSGWAKDNGVILVGGSVPELDGERIYNTCFVFDAEGGILARHRKIHLFDIDMPGMHFHESHTFTPGDSITVFDTPYGKMGCAVCFDVRFPEIFRAMAKRGAGVVFLPAQFNQKTGPMHWELALRSRAVDNQLFIVGASAAKYEGFSYECWGHSTVVGPGAEILASCDEKEQILYAELDLDRIAQAREELPLLKSLRNDVYPVAE